MQDTDKCKRLLLNVTVAALLSPSPEPSPQQSIPFSRVYCGSSPLSFFQCDFWQHKRNDLNCNSEFRDHRLPSLLQCLDCI
ncbi:unnamed protein product [Linum trigynum]|uniref:Secreted protein n=1 Tax=Linum trigynum TaxID=586398 RepID=A0AAV2FNR8_9ROSI